MTVDKITAIGQDNDATTSEYDKDIPLLNKRLSAAASISVTCRWVLLGGRYGRPVTETVGATSCCLLSR